VLPHLRRQQSGVWQLVHLPEQHLQSTAGLCL